MDKDMFFEDHGSIEKRENSLYESLEIKLLWKLLLFYYYA